MTAATQLSATGRRLLYALLATGLLIRLALAFTTDGVTYDIDSYVEVDGALGMDPLQLYTIVNERDYNRWPYMSGYLPFVVAANVLESLGGSIRDWVQLPAIVADAALAWLVQAYLGRRGATERVRLAAAALVALGPSFVAISGYHGQFDSVAILPAVAAVYVWDVLPPGPRRALIAGALVGTGIALKTAPGLVLLALLPTATSNRERLATTVAAAAVPLAAMAPWLVADPGGVVEALRSHRAVPGVGGLSLLVQPDLSTVWLGTRFTPVSETTQWLVDQQTAIVALTVIPFAVLVARRRVAPARAATILWLAFYVFATAFAFQYAVWGLPFALMAGHVRQVAAAQGALLVPTVLVYGQPLGDGAEYVYAPLMIGLWLGMVYALIRTTAGRTAPRIAA